jgi:hypothetical protein
MCKEPERFMNEDGKGKKTVPEEPRHIEAPKAA